MYLNYLTILALFGFVSTYHFQPDASPLDASSAEAAVLSIRKVLDKDTVPAGLSVENKENRVGLKSSAAAKFMKRLFEQYRNQEFRPEKGNMVRSILPKVGFLGLRSSISFDLSGINVKERVIKAKIYIRLDEIFNRRYFRSKSDSDLQRIPVAMATIDSSGVKSELPLLEDFGTWISFNATKLVRRLLIEQHLIKHELYSRFYQNWRDRRQRPHAKGHDTSAGASTFSVAFGFREFGKVQTFQVGKSLRRREPFLLVYSDDSKTTPVEYSLEEIDQLLNDFPEELDQKLGQRSKWTHQRVKRSLLPKDPSYYKYKSRSRQSRRHENLPPPISVLGDIKFSSRVESAVKDSSHEGGTGAVEFKPEKTDPYYCQKISFFVDFGAIGWNEAITSPSGFHQNVCVGSCAGHSIRKFPRSNYFRPTMPTPTGSRGIPDVATPCCVPSRTAPLTILYRDDDVISLKIIQNMVVEECACLG